jgi:hypothetical protein
MPLAWVAGIAGWQPPAALRKKSIIDLWDDFCRLHHLQQICSQKSPYG